MKIALDTRFDVAGHAEPWRNYLAAELNKLMQAAEAHTPLLKRITISVVTRVANFEEIQVAKPLFPLA